jgi:hypothetical protein
MRYHHKLFMIMAICASSSACAVEEAEDGALAREALVEEADEQVSLAATEHAACMAEPEAACEATQDELFAAVEHLRELQADEVVFRSIIEITCGNKTQTCTGISCWGQDEIGCVCVSENSGDISLCVSHNDQ